VELEQAVSRGDQPPLRACGGSASSLELVDPSVVLGLSEHGLDHRLAFSVKPAAVVTGEHGPHEGVAAAIPAAAGCVALAGIGRDQDLSAVADDLVDLLLMPVAGVCERDGGRVSLISDGRDLAERDGGSTLSAVELIGSDATGANVIFTTVDPLVHQDTNSATDYYDARIDGGFPAPTAEAPCEGEACHPGESKPAPFGPLETLTFTGPGNLVQQIVKPPPPKPETPPPRSAPSTSRWR
jgi:hypothetical protein